MTTSSQQDQDSINNVALPLANITRIFKDTVPNQCGLSREARNSMNHATVTYINYITAIAHEITTKAKKKTISATDMLAAIEAAGLKEFMPVLRQALDQFQASRNEKKVGGAASKPLETPPQEHPSSSSIEDENDDEIDIV